MTFYFGADGKSFEGWPMVFFQSTIFKETFSSQARVLPLFMLLLTSKQEGDVRFVPQLAVCAHTGVRMKSGTAVCCTSIIKTTISVLLVYISNKITVLNDSIILQGSLNRDLAVQLKWSVTTFF